MSALGLEYIHLLTANKKAILRFDLRAFRSDDEAWNERAYAEYGKFWIGDALSNYSLEEISDYKGESNNNTSD